MIRRNGIRIYNRRVGVPRSHSSWKIYFRRNYASPVSGYGRLCRIIRGQARSSVVCGVRRVDSGCRMSLRLIFPVIRNTRLLSHRTYHTEATKGSVVHYARTHHLPSAYSSCRIIENVPSINRFASTIVISLNIPINSTHCPPSSSPYDINTISKLSLSLSLSPSSVIF